VGDRLSPKPFGCQSDPHLSNVMKLNNRLIFDKRLTEFSIFGPQDSAANGLRSSALRCFINWPLLSKSSALIFHKFGTTRNFSGRPTAAVSQGAIRTNANRLKLSGGSDLAAAQSENGNPCPRKGDCIEPEIVCMPLTA